MLQVLLLLLWAVCGANAQKSFCEDAQNMDSMFYYNSSIYVRKDGQLYSLKLTTNSRPVKVDNQVHRSILEARSLVDGQVSTVNPKAPANLNLVLLWRSKSFNDYEPYQREGPNLTRLHVPYPTYLFKLLSFLDYKLQQMISLGAKGYVHSATFFPPFVLAHGEVMIPMFMKKINDIIAVNLKTMREDLHIRIKWYNGDDIKIEDITTIIAVDAQLFVAVNGVFYHASYELHKPLLLKKEPKFSLAEFMNCHETSPVVKATVDDQLTYQTDSKPSFMPSEWIAILVKATLIAIVAGLITGLCTVFFLFFFNAPKSFSSGLDKMSRRKKSLTE